MDIVYIYIILVFFSGPLRGIPENHFRARRGQKERNAGKKKKKSN